jgi:hypothetical protein
MEDKREGYPLVSDRKSVMVQGWPAAPAPKEERAKHSALHIWEARNAAAPSPSFMGLPVGSSGAPG